MNVVMVINRINPHNSFVYEGESRKQVVRALAEEIANLSGISMTEAKTLLQNEYTIIQVPLNRI